MTNMEMTPQEADLVSQIDYARHAENASDAAEAKVASQAAARESGALIDAAKEVDANKPDGPHYGVDVREALIEHGNESQRRLGRMALVAGNDYKEARRNYEQEEEFIDKNLFQVQKTVTENLGAYRQAATEAAEAEGVTIER